MRRWSSLLLAVMVLALAGCSSAKPVIEAAKAVPAMVKKPELQELLVQAAGPFEQRLEFAGGHLLLSSAQNGVRTLSFVLPDGKEGWKRAGAAEQLPADGKVSLEGELVLVGFAKEGSPKVLAFQAGSSGLSKLDYYRERAPEPAVTTGHFVLVNKHVNKLWHYLDGKLVKVYDVATGRQTGGPTPTWEDFKTNFFTPEGTFTLTNFVENPGYNALKPGDKSYEGGAPGNPLGTRWMGFEVLSGDNAWIWGIHGTSEPEKIGTWASDGCIRMFTKDAEELFSVIKGKNAKLQVVGR